MEGYEVTNDQGQRAWWDGQRIIPLPKQDSQEKLNTDIQQTATKTQADVANSQATGSSLMGTPTPNLQAVLKQPRFKPSTPEAELSAANRPLEKGYETLVSEGGQGIGRAAQLTPSGIVGGLAQTINAPAAGVGEAAGTATQNLLARVPGLGGAGGVIPAAGGALANAATQIGTGNLLMKPVVAGTKAGFKGLSEILNPGAVRKAGVEAVASRLGSAPTTLERAFQTPASKAAYEVADAVGPVNPKGAADVIAKAFQEHQALSNPDQKALRYLNNLGSKFGKSKSLQYSDMIDEVQMLKAQADSALNAANPRNVLGQTLMDAREKILDVMDKMSPAYRKANMLYRRESATTDILNAVRTGTPGVALEKLIENNKSIAKTFGESAMKDISKIADALNDVASTTPAGGFRQMLSAITEPLGQMIGSNVGRRILRTTLSSTKASTPAGLNSAVQLWNAYRSQGGED